MGKLSLFGITFADNKTVYFPGDFIKGQVTIQAKEPIKTKAIKIEFVGRAYVHWTETETTGYGENQHTETRHYSATQNLFEQTVVVFGEGANQQTKLSQGQHLFPFQYQLPSPLPSSFEDNVAYIRYWVKGTIVKPRKSNSRHTRQAFTVLDTLDLNSIPNMLTPSASSDTKTLCCWCCTSGPIEVEFHTDRSGYVPGEFITINATVKNSSNSKVKYISAKLMQDVTYHATTKTMMDSRCVTKISGPAVGKRQTVNLTNESIHIPPLPPSESLHCRIIDINYSVMFKAHLRTCAVDMSLVAPVTIGTIPIRSLRMYGNQSEPMRIQEPAALMPTAPFSQATSPPPYPEVGSATNAPPLPMPSTASHQIPPNSTSAPTPSYATALGGPAIIKYDDDGGYTMGDTSFTPQYIYYDWDRSAFTYNNNRV